MSETKSPDGSFPTFPFTLAVDGESVTNDKLCTSATTGLGWIGKIIDGLGYLKARAPQVFVITTDGAGAVTVQRNTPTEDGSTDLFSSVTISGTTTVRCVFATPLASAYDCCATASAARNGVGGDQLANVQITTTYVDVTVWDISDAGGTNITTTAVRVNLAVWPSLAGYT